MAKPKKETPKIEDEPGAEERFMRGVRNALATPPKPFTPKKSDASGKAKTLKKKPARNNHSDTR